MTDTPDDTTPAEAKAWAEQNWQRFAEVGSFDFACEAYEAGAARAAAAQLERIRRHFAGLPDNTGRPQWACAQRDLLAAEDTPPATTGKDTS